MASLLDRLLDRLSNTDAADGAASSNRALVTGSVALGALVTGAVMRRLWRDSLRHPSALPPALDGTMRGLELMEGCARFYHREGRGTPLVLLHSINAAGSSFEMKPIYDHYAATTDRPLYAMDWLGFGASDRRPVRFTPALYQRQLRRFMSEMVSPPADVVALSLGGEYAASVADALPFLFRRLVLISPTSMGHSPRETLWQRVLIEAADGVGAFELFFHRLTRRESLRRFYARQVFLDGQVPDELVDHAYATTHVQGAHHAPKRFVEGALFLHTEAQHAYRNLRTPTLLLAPESAAGTVQDFGRLDETAAENPDHLRVHRLASGLLPQWEAPEALLAILDEFLA